MMKGFGMWVLFFMIVFCLSSSFYSFPDARMKLKKVHNCRKLKEKPNIDPYEGKASSIDLLDYHGTDPVPSSKTSIRHGPIQHDVPLMPYIPKPPPPEPNNHQP
ncbi:hypothetical protein QVD17_39169 [Tagetes erecta]|uniref:Transmembrane protein n=1 Tax=Tagetes erecta TaxID=13708 RepID=A0AAD8N9Z4_TARER|nr:hypothetical protein QVD17_39169 [Tagetes erecta]